MLRAAHRRISSLFSIAATPVHPTKPELDVALPAFDALPAHRVTQSPDPTWNLGDGIRAPDPEGDVTSTRNALAQAWATDAERGWRTFNLEEMNAFALYMLLTSAVVPRPIALVSSLSANGVPNLSPFSCFSLISHDPPLLSIAFTLSPSRPKDTRENILATREFVVNVVSEPFIEAANMTTVDAPSDIDEWELSGLTRVPCEVVSPPRVQESAVSFECELYTHINIPRGSTSLTATDSEENIGTTIVLGRIRRMHVRRAVLSGAAPAASSLSPSSTLLTPPPSPTAPSTAQAKEGDGQSLGETAAEPAEIDPERLRAVARLGSTRYARIGAGFDIPVPCWSEVKPQMAKLKNPNAM